MGGACSSDERSPNDAAARPADAPDSARAETKSPSVRDQHACADGHKQALTRGEIALLNAQRNFNHDKPAAAASGSGDNIRAGAPSMSGSSTGSGGSGMTTSKVFDARKAVCSHVSERGMCGARHAPGSHFCDRHASQYTKCTTCRVHFKKATAARCVFGPARQILFANPNLFGQT